MVVAFPLFQVLWALMIIFSYANMEKALSLSDMPLVAGGTAAHRNWLKERAPYDECQQPRCAIGY